MEWGRRQCSYGICAYMAQGLFFGLFGGWGSGLGWGFLFLYIALRVVFDSLILLRFLCSGVVVCIWPPEYALCLRALRSWGLLVINT